MLSALRSWRGITPSPAQDIARSLADFGGIQPSVWQGEKILLTWARPSQCHHGRQTVTLFCGWIDNRADIAGQLGIPDTGDAAIYDAALAHWGEKADARIVGHYSAITALPDGRLRLSRSPWTAPPLHYANNADQAVAASTVQAIFAAGHPRELDEDYILDALVFDYRHGENCGWFKGIRRVPLGSAVMLEPGNTTIARWYDPLAVPPVRLARDEDYVEQALALLDEAAGKALAGSERPGLLLSGGLDSPLVADALLARMPATQRLPSFTFVPDRQWDGTVPDNLMGDEEPFVRAFAAMHPRLDPHFADPAEAGFDCRLRDVLAACGQMTINAANIGAFHGPWRMAKDAGCDWLLTADLGNLTYSNDGIWCYPEYLLTGRWRQLYLTLRDRPGDDRPMWRKIMAMSALPLLPGRIRRSLRAQVRPTRADSIGLFSLLNAEGRTRQAARQRERGGDPAASEMELPASREQAIRTAYLGLEGGDDLDLGFERIYGLRKRDVTAYRPLIEFCLGLPTDQFAKDGVQRRLAKRMAAGRMPEAQRLNRRYGRHNVDWHTRMGRRRAELKDYAERMRDHPFLGQIMDIDRMVALLDDWPATTPWSPQEEYPRRLGITRAVTVAQFVGYVEGRNDL